MKTTATNRKLRQLLTGINSGHLIPRPDFQRRLVWANKHKLAFIKTVLEQFPFPEIYVASGKVDEVTGEGYELLVDGQQRISTLYQYFSGTSELRLGKVPKYLDLTSDQKLAFLEYEVVVRDLGKMPIEDIKNIFTRINSTNYALNAMEVRNARFEGELKSFSEELTQDSFFENNHVFSAAEIRRMNDIRFVLVTIATMLEGVFDEDDKVEDFLVRYNDQFDREEEVRKRLRASLDFIDGCQFDRKSRLWKKADLFSLIVEVDRLLNLTHTELDPVVVSANLSGFYSVVDTVPEAEGLDQLVAQYYRASIQGTNHRISRVKRGESVRFILKQEELLDWSQAKYELGSTTVDEMIEWFLEEFEDPANGVPYDSGEGGYQYVNGGPYEASEELQEQYPDIPDFLIERACSRLNSMCWEWIKKGQY